MATGIIHEDWRVVEGFPAYAVSNLCRVKRIGRARGATAGAILRSGTHVNNGYPHVFLTLSPQKYKCVYVHHIVCRTFNGDAPTDQHQVAHNDGNILNCSAANLRWATAKENAADRVKHGTLVRGSKQHAAKLTENQVLEIRKMSRKGLKPKEIAKKFEVDGSLICHIMAGRAWAWLPDTPT